MPRSTDLDATTRAAFLRSRAADLSAAASRAEPPLAAAYRRRAAELRLEAMAAEVAAGIETSLERSLAAA